MAAAESSSRVLVGEGALARVYLDGFSVIKESSKALLVALRAVDAAVRERDALRRANAAGAHFAVRLLGGGQDAESIHLRLEAVLFAGISLTFRRLINQPKGLRIPPDAVACLACGCMSGLAELHSAGVVHRDIKPENLLLGEDGVPRLCDFGCARELSGVGGCGGDDDGEPGRLKSLVGTLAYQAPEMLSRGGHGCEVDWWSLGIIVHELLTGRVPWSCRTHDELRRCHAAFSVTCSPFSAYFAAETTTGAWDWQGEHATLLLGFLRVFDALLTPEPLARGRGARRLCSQWRLLPDEPDPRPPPDLEALSATTWQHRPYSLFGAAAAAAGACVPGRGGEAEPDFDRFCSQPEEEPSEDSAEESEEESGSGGEVSPPSEEGGDEAEEAAWQAAEREELLERGAAQLRSSGRWAEAFDAFAEGLDAAADDDDDDWLDAYAEDLADDVGDLSL
jgi:serine/threonine protein kinase